MQGTMNACCTSHVCAVGMLTASMMFDSHAHVTVTWCVNCNSIVMIQRRAGPCVCAFEITAHVLTADTVTVTGDALIHITPHVPGLIEAGASAEERGSSQQQCVLFCVQYGGRTTKPPTWAHFSVLLHCCSCSVRC